MKKKSVKLNSNIKEAFTMNRFWFIVSLSFVTALIISLIVCLFTSDLTIIDFALLWLVFFIFLIVFADLILLTYVIIMTAYEYSWVRGTIVASYFVLGYGPLLLLGYFWIMNIFLGDFISTSSKIEVSDVIQFLGTIFSIFIPLIVLFVTLNHNKNQNSEDNRLNIMPILNFEISKSGLSVIKYEVNPCVSNGILSEYSDDYLIDIKNVSKNICRNVHVESVELVLNQEKYECEIVDLTETGHLDLVVSNQGFSILYTMKRFEKEFIEFHYEDLSNMKLTLEIKINFEDVLSNRYSQLFKVRYTIFKENNGEFYCIMISHTPSASSSLDYLGKNKHNSS